MLSMQMNIFILSLSKLMKKKLHPHNGIKKSFIYHEDNKIVDTQIIRFLRQPFRSITHPNLRTVGLRDIHIAI